MTLVARKRKTNAEYSELLDQMRDIPALPMVAMRVNDLINNPNSSGSDIAQVLKKDQVLTAKILRLVNSSYYAIPGGVTDVQRALAFLGFTLAAGVTAYNLFVAWWLHKGNVMPLLSLLAVAFGGYVAFAQWSLIQQLMKQHKS